MKPEASVEKLPAQLLRQLVVAAQVQTHLLLLFNFRHKMMPNRCRDNSKLCSDRLSKGVCRSAETVQGVRHWDAGTEVGGWCVCDQGRCRNLYSVLRRAVIFYYIYVALFPLWPQMNINQITFSMQHSLTAVRFIAVCWLKPELYSISVEIPPDRFECLTMFLMLWWKNNKCFYWQLIKV